MRLLRKITNGEFSEFIQEKNNTYSVLNELLTKYVKVSVCKNFLVIFELGPMMGHCVATVDPWTILVVGGFSPETADYIDKAYFLNTKTKEWYTKPWSKLKYGKEK